MPKEINLNQKRYTIAILSKIKELFSEDSMIDVDDFKNDENLTLFVHCLANIAPCMIFNELTGAELNLIDFNHVANKMVIQNIEIID